ncbi:hypothetical protein [Photobacterium lutimaris]|uniref:Uncharacterized protein n=1 Tax=Photobacterium lutimaris TaxID=388278 RepID=A0A2T3J0L4_9GAMM|nr:hypothetical protein [Photobacterium lutimaris]PSU34619.1 hypothetical protein C9I99_05845 [Photobacterium lutimaris]TDR71536.1 hypothetical protein DFP78_11670 [Photobacterium lutimaris]
MFKITVDLGKVITELKQRKSIRNTAALEAIRRALQETNIYLSSQKKNPQKEEELSELWSRAAVDIRHADPGLARRLNLKGRYWLQRDGYSLSDLFDSKINLEEINRDYENLLGRL